MYERDVCVYQAVCVCFYSGLVFVVWADTSIACRQYVCGFVYVFPCARPVEEFGLES